jgi:hypothetical protein
VTGDTVERPIWHEWRPLLGESYTRELIRIRRRQYLWFAVGVGLMLLMVGSIFALGNSAWLWAIVPSFVLLAVGSFLAGSLPLLALGKRMAI